MNRYQQILLLPIIIAQVEAITAHRHHYLVMWQQHTTTALSCLATQTAIDDNSATVTQAAHIITSK